MPQWTLRGMAAGGLVMVLTMTTTTPEATTAQNPSDPVEPEPIVWDLSEMFPTEVARGVRSSRCPINILSLR